MSKNIFFLTLPQPVVYERPELGPVPPRVDGGGEVVHYGDVDEAAGGVDHAQQGVLYKWAGLIGH